MRIIKAFPPNYLEIMATFPNIKGKPGIIYAWGETLYNPSGGDIPPWLIAHEEVHGQRQGPNTQGLIYTWWDRYLNDEKFRLDEELLAHQAEYDNYAADHSPRATEMYLTLLSQRLAGSLYGWMTDEYRAYHLIKRDFDPDSVLPGEEG